MVIRPASPDDAAGIAAVHVAAWQTAYRGLIPQDYLDGLCVDERHKQWSRILLKAEEVHYVAEEDRIVGFSVGGPARDDFGASTGELYSLYLLSEWRRGGLGRQLFGRVAATQSLRGMTSLYAWALEENPFRGFYEGLGGRICAERETEIAGKRFGVVAFRWDDLAGLIARTQNVNAIT
ncbi:FR47-like protein [Maioricimonas rarisocia]|uniref:FR47-like protein n=1 Tax=Maioricimonas rarisocia TaxID=2528026 RepID=A0A517ZCH5_9PLAN|nr:GNAT family N-acetyltransferase [Maioricimonas rarisocia]QDU40157.1 FR47-like protein [Maioricimonas rarisocia]